MKILNNIWNALGTKQVTNIISVLAFIAMPIFGYFGISKTTDIQNEDLVIAKNISIIAIIVFVFLAVSTILNIVVTLYNKRKYLIIDILCRLQNKYILDPKFKTSKAHSEQSKEKYLSAKGNAKILTNSLSYDLFYTDSIATNIINGAKYVYMLPENEKVLGELRSYVSSLYQNLHEKIQSTNRCQQISDINKKVTEIFTNKLEFWFFAQDIPCLYNFAELMQTKKQGSNHFTQSWWYINPVDHQETSTMLSVEIQDISDQTNLKKVFEELKKISKTKKGIDVYDEFENTSE
ncbi:MAG: hypothetical protein FWG98_14125 [Candidatus Cloacimonetes bacterium]|nr:hypothetical protein [Candidatus Cloacimonadota bacterium]